MKQLFEVLRIIVISFEMLLFIIVVGMYFYLPEILISVGNHFKSNNDILKFIPTVPISLSVFSVQYAWKILMPLGGNSSNRILHEWPNYWKLKYRVIVSVALCVACSLSIVTIWFFSSSISGLMVGAIFIISIGISLAVSISEFLTAIKVRELLEP